MSFVPQIDARIRNKNPIINAEYEKISQSHFALKNWEKNYLLEFYIIWKSTLYEWNISTIPCGINRKVDISSHAQFCFSI